MTEMAVRDRTYLAYQAKLAGFAPEEICEKLDYPSAEAVLTDIKRHLEKDARSMKQELRANILDIELDRLDYLQSRVWPQCEYGDLKSIETALKIIQTRTRLLGLDAVNTQTQGTTVLVVGGEEQNYIEKLKQAAGEIEP